MTICKKIKTWWNEQSPFKAYIGWNLFLIFIYLCILFTIPIKYPEDHPIYGSMAVMKNWVYTSLSVWFYTTLRSTIIYILLFFLAMSNKDKHPRLAKFLFLFPWIYIVARNIIYYVFENYANIL